MQNVNNLILILFEEGWWNKVKDTASNAISKVTGKKSESDNSEDNEYNRMMKRYGKGRRSNSMNINIERSKKEVPTSNTTSPVANATVQAVQTKSKESEQASNTPKSKSKPKKEVPTSNTTSPVANATVQAVQTKSKESEPKKEEPNKEVPKSIISKPGFLSDLHNKYKNMSGTQKAVGGAALGAIAVGGIAAYLRHRRKKKERETLHNHIMNTYHNGPNYHNN